MRSDRLRILTFIFAISAEVIQAPCVVRGQETYVKITGSTSTGRQTFNGKNGQIRLPAGVLPAFPAEGTIQNVTGTGLEIYTGGVWVPIGSGSASQTGGSGYARLFAGTTGVTVSSLSASFIDTMNASGNVARVLSVSKTVNFSINGEGGLDTGSIAIDSVYYKYLLVKSDQSASTLVASLSSSIAGVTIPAAYVGGYSRYVGVSITKHTSATLFTIDQRAGVMTPYWSVEGDLVADGGQFVTNNTATGTQTASYATRISAWVLQATFKVQLTGIASNAGRYIVIYNSSGSNSLALCQQTATTNGSGNSVMMVTMPINNPGVWKWGIGGSGGTPGAWFAIQSFVDDI